ncbi:MAG: NusG domain II-containing protein [Betaproteobacteria bacterium]|nr:NusG domain II-containing protein [Betaproteobacteria bacterium]
MRAGDWLVLTAAAATCAALFAAVPGAGAAQRAEIRRDGAVFASVALDRPRLIEVPGPLGTTRIEVQPGRARVAADPGPRQYCVRQGWLTQANAIAICAPNHVSLALVGRSAAYDSLNF